MTATRQLAFRELNIIRMPGLPGSIRLQDLGPGVVIIAGPNASGKTTTARVMNYLLWPEAAEKELAQFGYKLHHLSLRGTLEIGGEEWTAGYETGSRLLRRGNAQEKELPIPPREHQQRYNLALSQLLTGDDRNFAVWIHREAMGGFDPDRAGGELIQRTSLPKKNLSEYRAWQQASDRVSELTKEDQRLHRDQQRLADLVLQREQFGSKVRKIRMFEWVIDLRETESRLDEVSSLLGSYPEAHAQYHVQIRTSIEEAGESSRQLASEIDGLGNDLAGYRREQQETGLPEGGVPQERMDRLAALLRDAEEYAAQTERIDRDIAAAEAERAGILKQIGKGGDGAIDGTVDSAVDGPGSDAGNDSNNHSGTLAGLGAKGGPGAASPALEGFNPEWVQRSADLVKREAEAENRRLAAESELALLQDTEKNPGETGTDTTGQKSTETTGQKVADTTGQKVADTVGKTVGPDRKAGGQNQAKDAPGGIGGASAGDVRKGIDLLTEWIRDVAGAQLRGILPLRAAGMLLLAAAAAAGMLVDPWAGLLVLVPAIWLLVEWLLLRKARADAETGRIPRNFSKSGLGGLKRWETGAVKDRLLDLVEAYLPLRESERRRDRRKILDKKRVDALAVLREIESQREQLVVKSGIAPKSIGLPELHFLLHHIHKYNETLNRLSRLHEERKGLNAARIGLETEFRELIREYDDPESKGAGFREDGDVAGAQDLAKETSVERAPISIRDLREQLDRLLRRNNRWRELEQKIQNAEEQLHKAQNRQKQEQERVSKLYGTVGLDSGDFAGLLKLDGQHDEYQEYVRQKQVLTQKRESILSDIGRHEAFEPAVPELTREQAEAEVASCRRAEEAEKEIQKEITSIETLLNKRMARHDLADAIRLEDTAREKLAEQFDNYLSDIVLSRTIRWLKKENQRHNYPDVFYRANKLFRSFTENRYELEVVQDGGTERDAGRISANGGPGFVAVDHGSSGDMYPLDRLSEGTRIQLLLAVRMAFVEQLESGVRLPFFADELLAVSDDARAGAIMDALLTISREGRQVFYFTAQGDEVEKWMQKAAATGDQNLVQVRTLGRNELFRAGGDGLSGEGAGDAVTTPRWRFGYGSDVPRPDGKSHRQYGVELNVPAIDPLTTEADRLHPWYLTEETDLVYECLRNGLLTWRQVDQFLENDGILPVGEEKIGKLKEAARLAASALDLWREGRPRPITPSALRESGAVTDAYLERADTLARKVGYNPVRFLEEIDQGALPRFRDDKKTELRTWLDENSYLPETEPLSVDEMQVRLRALSSGFRYLEPEEAERMVMRVMDGPVKDAD